MHSVGGHRSAAWAPEPRHVERLEQLFFGAAGGELEVGSSPRCPTKGPPKKKGSEGDMMI